MIGSSLASRKSRRLIRTLTKQRNLCRAVDRTLMVNTRDDLVFDAFYVDINSIPVLLHVVHGITIEYPDNVSAANVLNVLNWIETASVGNVRRVSEINVETS